MADGGNGGKGIVVIHVQHLPECNSLYWNDVRPVPLCICDRLRACEERVTADAQSAMHAMFRAGYACGLDDAREAVGGMHLVAHNSDDDFGTTWNRAIDTALEQVDALRDPAPTATPQDIADDRAEHQDREEGAA